MSQHDSGRANSRQTVDLDLDSLEPASYRDEVHRLKSDIGCTLSDVLLLSAVNDPMNYGTAGDHAKAAWFRDLWEHAVADRDEDEIHIRGVHYSTLMREEDVEPPSSSCDWDIYQNTSTCASYLNQAAKAARILGYVPWEGILDEKNNQTRVTTYESHILSVDPDSVGMPSDGASVPGIPKPQEEAEFQHDNVGDFYQQFARWESIRLKGVISVDWERLQPYHIEVWSEKTLPPEVKKTAKRAGAAAIVEGEGELSYGVANDFAKRVNEAGKPAIVKYLADFDAAGTGMARSMGAKLMWLAASGRLEHRAVIDKLAITHDQIREHDLPRKPVDAEELPDNYGTRNEEFEREYGEGIVELNVLETNIDLFRGIVREGIRQHRDTELTEKRNQAKREWKDAVGDEIKTRLAEEDVGQDDILLLNAWVDDVNTKLSDAEEILGEIRELVDDDWRVDKWNEKLAATWSKIEPPDFDPPKGEADMPADPIFDSSRGYLENVERAKYG